MTIDERIEKLDVSLFSHIATTTPEEDQRSLLALQAVFRKTYPGFVYLEVGSFLGGSLQPFVVDSKCGKIISIDPRPGVTPDTRGTMQYGELGARLKGDFSLGRMLKDLGDIPGSDMRKLQTFEASTSDLTPNMIGVHPQFCFVDGEHTDAAVMRDGRFCLSVLAENGVIAFHDANLVYKGLQSFLAELTASGRPFRARILPNCVFLFEFGTVRFCEMEPLRQRVEESYKAYLAGMLANDIYLRTYYLPFHRALRKIGRFFQKGK